MPFAEAPALMVQRIDPFAGILGVPAEHREIDDELLNWARWVTSGRSRQQISPMFRLFRSNMARGEYGAPTAEPSVDAIRALTVERAMRRLPEQARELLRGWYVFRLPPWTLCKMLVIKKDRLCETLHDARTMARNVLRA